MLPFQERVVQEKNELDVKIKKLDDFIHSEMHRNLPEDERLRMLRQFCHMKDYSNILGDRIAYFV